MYSALIPAFLILAPDTSLPGRESVDPLLETITVTATRRETNVLDVTAPVSQSDARDVQLQAPDVIAQVLRGRAGAFVQQTTPGQGIPIVRGLKGSQVLHLVDGVRLNNAFFRDAPNQYLGLVDPLNVSRVEVLRGAAGSLYGADAMGGVVQVLTGEARFTDARSTSRYGLYSSFDSADDGWLGRAEAAVGNRDGSLALGFSWQDRGDRRTGGGDTVRPSGFRSRAGDLVLLLGSPDRGEWTISARTLEQPDTPRVDELVPGFGQTQPSSSRFAFTPNRRSMFHGRFRRENWMPGLEFLEAHLARQVITDDRLTQDFGSDVITTEQNQSTLDGLILGAQSRPSPRLVLSWGAEAYRDRIRSARQETFEPTGSTTTVRSRFPDRSRIDSDAIHVAAGWRISGSWAVDAGLRYSRFCIRLPETTASPAVALDPDDLTGDLRLRFEVAEGVALLANMGRGFRPPNVFDLGTLGPRPGNRFNVVSPGLAPESLWSADLGLKVANGGWQGELFFFALDYRDRIGSVATGAVTPEGRIVVRSENRDEVSIVGFEGAVTWQPLEQLEASATLNWTRGEEQESAEPAEPADRIPPLNGRLALVWRPAARWQVEGVVDFAATQDRLSARDLEDPRMDPGGTDGWTTINLYAQWMATPEFRVGLRLENLLDTAYREHGSGLNAPGFNLGVWVDTSF